MLNFAQDGPTPLLHLRSNKTFVENGAESDESEMAAILSALPDEGLQLAIVRDKDGILDVEVTCEIMNGLLSKLKHAGANFTAAAWRVYCKFLVCSPPLFGGLFLYRYGLTLSVSSDTTCLLTSAITSSSQMVDTREQPITTQATRHVATTQVVTIDKPQHTSRNSEVLKKPFLELEL